VTLLRSKMDREAAGRHVGVPYGSNPATSPVRVYGAWIETAELTEGPVLKPVHRQGNIGRDRITDRGVALGETAREESRDGPERGIGTLVTRRVGGGGCRGPGKGDRPHDWA
jgi:hypothetical protein